MILLRLEQDISQHDGKLRRGDLVKIYMTATRYNQSLSIVYQDDTQSIANDNGTRDSK